MIRIIIKDDKDTDLKVKGDKDVGRIKTISDFKDISDDELWAYFSSACIKQKANENIKYIFNIAMMDKSLFPRFLLITGASYKDYIDRWIKAYIDADNNPPSKRVASPKRSCSDPAVKSVVKIATGASDDEAQKQESHHNLFMSSENIQGQLLEEYISISVSEHGWFWCKGNTLRSVDFCTKGGEILLQVKNKFNSENSSSSDIRHGTSIEKWYRLGEHKVGGVMMPVYKWEVLNRVIRKASGKKCEMSEEKYIKFLEGIVSKNTKIITDK